MAGPRPRRLSRREALRLGAMGGAVLLAACTGTASPPDERERDSPAAPATRIATPEATAVPTPTSTPVATPSAPPTPHPRGREEVALMEGTEWETSLVATHSGVEGPTLLVLGGVHGNEPGGWMAADGIAEWEPARGSLLVAPRANVTAISLFERTTDALGDLNRLYPGSFDAELPMARMAAHIVDVARRYEVDVVLDLHESWGFYAERGENAGTAFLGPDDHDRAGGDRVPFARLIAGRVNRQIELERELMLPRDWTEWPAAVTDEELAAGAPEAAMTSALARSRWRPGGWSSSLSLGRIVPGVLPVLVEMGQDRQHVDRRVELHRLVVQSTMELLRMA